MEELGTPGQHCPLPNVISRPHTGGNGSFRRWHSGHRELDWGAVNNFTGIRRILFNGGPLGYCMDFSVVGIGASAGGLEAFRVLLEHLPADTGLAFVFIQHLDPTHTSDLTKILSACSSIPVQLAVDDLDIEPNHLYVIPPAAALEIADHKLRLTPRVPNRSAPHTPIDQFLTSLARECGSRAIGVILSGAGTDGAKGLEAVKAVGGATFAQDPITASFDSMPRTSIMRGCVDFVLSPEAIGDELTKLAQSPDVNEATDQHEPMENIERQFGSILAVLRDATGIDFGLYRETTIRRRIIRRLALCNLGSLEEYRERIQNDPLELSALQRDLLIRVTRFFRDPAVFENLKNVVFPRLAQDRPADSAIRVWVAGCATGEEAYSVAISLEEFFQDRGHAWPVQIFASDISPAAIERARTGKYADTIAADVGAERLKRCFSKVDGGYVIDKSLREMCVFSRHDLIHDPPFSKLDLISCQNTLIFFGDVRHEVIARFHYALKPDGFLVLGPSKAESGDLFSAVRGAPGIFTKNEITGRARLRYGGVPGPDRSSVPAATSDSLRKKLANALLSRYRGAGVVVDDKLEVLEIIGQTAPYLALRAGKVSLNLLNLIPEAGLFLEVEKLVGEVERSGEATRRSRSPYQAGGTHGELNLEVIPLGAAEPRTFLVLFEPLQDLARDDAPPYSDPKDREIARLKQNLAHARQRLLTIDEEHEHADQERWNAADEALSTNEELQSLNEELETAKEELQSINEELTTVNDELLSANVTLTEARDFNRSIVETAAYPLLVLDQELRIDTANGSFYQMFGIGAGDLEGQMLFSISDGCWDIPGLREMLESVLREHKTVQGFEVEQDFPDAGRKTLVLSATQLGGTQKVLLSIEDITEIRSRSESKIRESEERFRSMADSAPVLMWVSDVDKACTFFNKPWLEFTGRTMDQELGNGWTESVHPDDMDQCWSTYSSAFDARRSFQMEYRLMRDDGQYRWLLDIGIPRFDLARVFSGYIGSCIDITDLKNKQEEDLARLKMETVGTMAEGIVHDFNNLLGGILANSDLALEGLSTGSKPVEELHRIRAAGLRGAEIARQLMVFAGRETQISEAVGVSAIVEDMLELLKVSVSKHATLEADLRRNLPPVLGNPAEIRQVVMNLISNASEAIGDRDGVIRVATSKVTAGPDSPVPASKRMSGRDYILLEVTDTGRGMTPEVQARIFDPLFTTKRTGGHGHGLTVVQRILDRLHGTVQVSSAPGEGTAFQIFLPSEATGASEANPASSVATETLQPVHATILVVDDEELLRQAVSKILRRHGFSVMEASDGSAALDALRAHREGIDLLVLDITLPGASSREVYYEARQLKPGLPVIVISAKSEEMAGNSLGTKVEHFLRKPFLSVDLIDRIQTALASVKAARKLRGSLSAGAR